MNITLSAPEETVRAVRAWADENHTSLNQFIRDRLEEKARELEEERARKAAGFAKFMDSVRVATYLPKLAGFVQALRSDLGVGEAVPFIAGQIQPRHENAARFNPVIGRVSEVIPNSFCVSSEGLATNPDNLHFTRDAQLELGRRYASVLFGADNDSTN